MGLSGSERRLLENEVVFRQFNQSIQDGVNQINQVALEEGETPLDFDWDAPLHFYCECADENCKQRVKLSPRKYDEIHTSRDIFTIIPGHEVEAVEEVIEQHEEY